MDEPWGTIPSEVHSHSTVWLYTDGRLEKSNVQGQKLGGGCQGWERRREEPSRGFSLERLKGFRGEGSGGGTALRGSATKLSS